jgi:hypothetical protein
VGVLVQRRQCSSVAACGSIGAWGEGEFIKGKIFPILVESYVTLALFIAFSEKRFVS